MNFSRIIRTSCVLSLAAILNTMPLRAEQTVADSTEAQKEWTFMVFLNGDNNLEGAGIKDINEMETIGSNDKVNILVQFDRCEGYDSTNGNWKDTRLYYVTKGESMKTIESQVVGELGEVDMGSGDELVKFVKWGKEKYPAKHYCVVMWNHGMGWRDEAPKQSSLIKGISYDDQSGNHIDTPAMGKAAKEIAQILGKKLDILAFDACLMQMAEVQYEVKDFVDVMIASEETEPGDGWPYDKVLPAFAAGKDTKVCASTVVDEYIEFYKNQSGGWWGPPAVTQACVDLAKAEELNSAMNKLGDTLTAALATDKAKIAAAREASQEYAVSDYVDLYHFVSLLDATTETADVKTACSSVMNLIKDGGLVINSKYAQTSMKDSHGVAFWFPKSTTSSGGWGSQALPYTKDNLEAYAKTAIALNGTWDNFLAAYHAKAETSEMIYAMIEEETKAAVANRSSASADYIDNLVRSYQDMLRNSPEAADAFNRLSESSPEVSEIIRNW